MLDLGELRMSIAVDDKTASNALSDIRSHIDQTDNNLQKHEGSWKKFGTSIGSIAKTGLLAAGAGLVAIGTAVTGVAVKAVGTSDEYKKSLNTLQTQTGSTTKEMEGLKKSLLSIYGKNYGESFEDVAQSLSNVKQQTGLAGEELENFTKNAMVLKDTFEYEVNESTRAADMMMKQFGVTGDEAFNLIAQGAQNGLDKNGNLLDSINEYSVHFAQLGMDAEDMFNMFSNGAESGVFDIDKLGDAVKEFGIRVKDGTADEAFAQLGLNAEELKTAFNEGGDAAQEAFKKVNTALAECDDKTTQTTLGVTMYGTMWEDMGVGAVAALANMNGEFDSTLNTMQQINSIKYDSFSQAMTGIGRQIEVGVLVPLGEKLMPSLNEFANWISDHMPQIQSVVDTTFTVVGTVIDVTNTAIGTLIGWVQNLVSESQTSGTKVNEIWTSVKENFNQVFTSIKGFLESFFSFCKTFWDTWGETILAMLNITFGVLIDAFNTVLDMVLDIFDVWAKIFQGDWKGAWEAIQKLYSDIAKNLINLFENWVKNYLNMLQKFADNFNTAWSKLWNNVKSEIKSIWDSICSWFDNAVMTPVRTITGIGSKMYSAGKEIFNSLWDGIKDVWSSISSWVSDKVDWIADKVTFWDNSQSRMSSSNSSSKANGSHRNGLDYVPFDGYKSILHQGEMILTEEKAEAYRDGLNGSQEIITVAPNITLNIGYANDEGIDKLKKIIRNEVPKMLTEGLSRVGVIRKLR